MRAYECVNGHKFLFSYGEYEKCPLCDGEIQKFVKVVKKI